jgi:hypothetical protein
MILAGRVDWLLSNVKQNVRGCVPIIVLIVFTLIGAILFKTIEGPHEEEELRNLKAKREKLLEVGIFFVTIKFFRTRLFDLTALRA